MYRIKLTRQKILYRSIVQISDQKNYLMQSNMLLTWTHWGRRLLAPLDNYLSKSTVPESVTRKPQSDLMFNLSGIKCLKEEEKRYKYVKKILRKSKNFLELVNFVLLFQSFEGSCSRIAQTQNSEIPTPPLRIHLMYGQKFRNVWNARFCQTCRVCVNFMNGP